MAASGARRRRLLWACLLVALARPVLAAGRIAADEDWRQWPICGEPRTPRRSGGTAVRKAGAEVEEEIHSIVQIGEDGLLTFSEQGDLDRHVISALRREAGPVHVVAVFGGLKAGKSTLLTALSCALTHGEGSHGDAVPVHFKPREGHKTFGLWASPPFRYRDKTFVLLDLEGLGDASNGGVGSDIEDPRKREHGLVKIIAMLSEVVSVFVYVSHAEHASTGDYDEISKAMRVTRRNLIYKDGEGDGEEWDKFQHASTDHPTLLISRRVQSVAKVRDGYLRKDRFDVDTDALVREAVEDFDGHVGPKSDFRQIMLDNFRNMSALPGRVSPFRNAPVIAMPNEDHHEYNWAEDLWLATEGGLHCQHYVDMFRAEHRCRERQSEAPPRAALYKMFVDHMAEDIYAISRVRTLKEQSGPGRPVSGRVFVDYLQTAVREMNRIRPLPETALWRAVLEESCVARAEELVEAIVGRSTRGCPPAEVTAGKCGGAVARIENLMRQRRDEVSKKKRLSWRSLVGALDSQDTLPRLVNDVWVKSVSRHAAALETLFEHIDKQADFAAVKEECVAPSARLVQQYEHLKDGFFFEAQKLTMELRLEAQIQRADWEASKWIWLMYGIAGLLGVIAVLNFLGKMHGAVSCLLACCGIFRGSRRRDVERNATAWTHGREPCGSRELGPPSHLDAPSNWGAPLNLELSDTSLRRP